MANVPISSADDIIHDLLDGILADKSNFDSDVVRLIQDHLGQKKVHTKAGNNLADALILLAKKRSQEAEK